VTSSVVRHTGTAQCVVDQPQIVDFQDLNLDSCHMGLLEADDVDLLLMNVIADDAGLAQDRPSSFNVDLDNAQCRADRQRRFVTACTG